MYKRVYKIKKKPFLLAVNLFIITFSMIIFYEVTLIGKEKFQAIMDDEAIMIKPRYKVRGIHPKLEYFYRRRSNFRCIYTKEVITYGRVNDNYCDCRDGTDEPGTNACSDSYFFCDVFEHQVVDDKLRHVILSSRVNDGICDCCDGSDEYGDNFAYKLSNFSSSPVPVNCPNSC